MFRPLIPIIQGGYEKAEHNFHPQYFINKHNYTYYSVSRERFIHTLSFGVHYGVIMSCMIE